MHAMPCKDLIQVNSGFECGCFTADSVLGFHLNFGSQFMYITWQMWKKNLKRDLHGRFSLGIPLEFRIPDDSWLLPWCCVMWLDRCQQWNWWGMLHGRGSVLGFHLSWESQMPPDRFNSVAWYYLTDTNIGIAGECFTAGSSLGFHMNWGTPVVSRLLH